MTKYAENANIVINNFSLNCYLAGRYWTKGHNTQISHQTLLNVVKYLNILAHLKFTI